jgi:hypothetical protein
MAWFVTHQETIDKLTNIELQSYLEICARARFDPKYA